MKSEVLVAQIIFGGIGLFFIGMSALSISSYNSSGFPSSGLSPVIGVFIGLPFMAVVALLDGLHKKKDVQEIQPTFAKTSSSPDKRNRSIQWHISGAIWLCVGLFTYMIKTNVDQNAFWSGTYGMSPIALAISQFGPFLIPIEVFLGIACFVVGLSKAGIITVTTEEKPAIVEEQPLPSPKTRSKGNNKAKKETVRKEYIMTTCNHCEALIPQTSTFCPDCGVRRTE